VWAIAEKLRPKLKKERWTWRTETETLITPRIAPGYKAEAGGYAARWLERRKSTSTITRDR
jgi:hypothetical protein